MSRVAITGASGLLGGNLAAELAAAGHQVVATRRAGTKVAHLDDVPIEWREAELGAVDSWHAPSRASTPCSIAPPP